MGFGGSGGGNGTISGSSDASMSNPTDGQVIAWNASLAKWQNKPSPATIDPTGMNVVTGTTVQLAVSQLDAGAVDYDTIEQQISDTATTAAAASATNSNRLDTIETDLLNAGALRLVMHGATASTARPPGTQPVLWFGTVTPTNATNNDLYWNGSTMVSLSVAPDTTPPAVPTISMTAGDGSITMTLGSVADSDFDHYVYRYGTTNPPTGVGTTTTQTTITASGVTDGTTYYAQVASVDTSGNQSAWSATSSATPAAVTAGTIVTSGLLARYDASTLSGAVSSTLTSWADSVGTYNLAGQTGAQPTISFGPNGSTLKGVTFNGTNQQLYNTALTAQAQPMTEIIVAKFGNLTASRALIATTSNTAGFRHAIGISSTGNVYASAGTTLPGGTADTNPHVYAAVFSGASSSLNVGNTQVTGNAGTDSRTGIRLGSTAPGNVYGAETVYEILLYNRALSASELSSTLSGLSSKWGVSI